MLATGAPNHHYLAVEAGAGWTTPPAPHTLAGLPCSSRRRRRVHRCPEVQLTSSWPVRPPGAGWQCCRHLFFGAPLLAGINHPWQGSTRLGRGGEGEFWVVEGARPRLRQPQNLDSAEFDWLKLNVAPGLAGHPPAGAQPQRGGDAPAPAGRRLAGEGEATGERPLSPGGTAHVGRSLRGGGGGGAVPD